MLNWAEPDYFHPADEGENRMILHPDLRVGEARGIEGLVHGACRNREAGIERAFEIYSFLARPIIRNAVISDDAGNVVLDACTIPTMNN